MDWAPEVLNAVATDLTRMPQENERLAVDPTGHRFADPMEIAGPAVFLAMTRRVRHRQTLAADQLDGTESQPLGSVSPRASAASVGTCASSIWRIVAMRRSGAAREHLAQPGHLWQAASGTR